MSQTNRDDDLLGMLRESASTAPEPDWRRMEDQLLRAFATRPASSAATRHVSWRRWRWAGAAAAVLLAAAITWMPNEPLRVTPTPPPRKPSATTTSQPPASRATTPAPTPRAAPPARPAPRPARAAAVDLGAQFADFVALPNAAALPYFESGRIVRIELAITELPSYGLELVPDAAPAAVKADLLVGQDGLPRAIRLAAAAR